jgi:anti-sigma factor RsiW
MRCRKAQEYISRSIDGELAERENARLERHLAACDECRALQADLRRIVRGAAGLAVPEPSEKVWLRIRAGVTAGQAEPASRRSGDARRPAFGLGLPALRTAGFAAAALFLVITGVIVGLRLGRPASSASVGPEAREKYTLAKLDEAERFYQQAIKSLSEAFAAEKGTLAPQVTEIFERNLTVIDTTIQACRRAVLAEPDDLDARNYLLAAYTQKITLLDSALDLQRKDRSAAGIKKTL